MAADDAAPVAMTASLFADLRPLPRATQPRAQKVDADETFFSRAREAWCAITENHVRLEDARLDTIDQPAHTLTALHDWLAGARGTLLVRGAVGTGKTWLAGAVAHHALFSARVDLENGHVPKVMFEQVSDLLAQLRPNGGGQVDHYVTTELLIIDDLGSESATDWTREQLFRIIDGRWRTERRTVITTNLTSSALRAHVGERAFDRLADGGCLLVLSGGSRRGEHRREWVDGVDVDIDEAVDAAKELAAAGDDALWARWRTACIREGFAGLLCSLGYPSGDPGEVERLWALLTAVFGPEFTARWLSPATWVASVVPVAPAPLGSHLGRPAVAV